MAALLNARRLASSQASGDGHALRMRSASGAGAIAQPTSLGGKRTLRIPGNEEIEGFAGASSLYYFELLGDGHLWVSWQRHRSLRRLLALIVAMHALGRGLCLAIKSHGACKLCCQQCIDKLWHPGY